MKPEIATIIESHSPQPRDNNRTNSRGPSHNTQAKYSVHTKKKELFEAISCYNTTKLKSILQRIELQDSLSITELVDDDGHNLLHRAAYDNTFRISEILILYYKQRLA